MNFSTFVTNLSTLSRERELLPSSLITPINHCAISLQAKQLKPCIALTQPPKTILSLDTPKSAFLWF